MLRDHGQAQKYYHDIEGYNGRLDSIQAGLLQVKLAHLAGWNQLRRDRAAEYNRLLAENEAVVCPHEPSWSRAVYHLYVIRTQDRDGLMKHLKEAGIATGIHYPVPLHMQKAYASMQYSEADLPVATRVAAEIVSLPMFPQTHFAAAGQGRRTRFGKSLPPPHRAPTSLRNSLCNTHIFCTIASVIHSSSAMGSGKNRKP